MSGSSRAARSRLGQSLLRLNRTLDAAHRNDDRQDDLFEEFRRRWWKGRRHIAGRLRMIEAQLDRLSSAKPAPRLAVIGVAADADEAAAMIGTPANAPQPRSLVAG